MALENLSVRISSQTADVRTSLNAVKRAFSGLGTEAVETAGETGVAGEALDELRDDAAGAAAAMFGLESRTDEAGDEMLALVPQASTASGAVTTFGVSTEGASVGVTSLSTSITAALIPAVGALSTVLFPIAAVAGTAATALGSLAGAFGLVIGAGAIAGFRRLKTTLTDSLSTIEAQLTGFGQAAVPVLDNILGQLPELVSDILGAFGGTDTFLQALTSGFQSLRRLAPQVVRTLRELAVSALPVLRDGINFLVQNGPSIFREMVSTTRELAPQIMEFVDAVIDATPALLEFGTFVFQTVVPALSNLGRQLTPLIEGFNRFAGFVGLLDARLQSLAPNVRKGLLAPFRAIVSPVTTAIDALESFQRLYAETAGAVASVVPDLNTPRIPTVPSGAPGTAGTGTGAQEIRVTGELRERDGEIVATIDERIDTRTEQKRQSAIQSAYARNNL